MIISRPVLLKIKYFQTKFVDKIKTHILCSVTCTLHEDLRIFMIISRPVLLKIKIFRLNL